MNKAQLVEKLAQKSRLTKVTSERVINAVISTIVSSLEKGDEVKISGFGRWFVTQRKEQRSRNPQTGEMIKISSQRAPAFRAGRHLKSLFR